MLLNYLLLFTLLAMLVSLFAGLFFLFKDRADKKRIVYALFARVFFAGLAIIIVIYAVFSGHFHAHSPIGLMPDQSESSE